MLSGAETNLILPNLPFSFRLNLRPLNKRNLDQKGGETP
jgi:hypothetical protein